jgi:hypothetical protein
VLTLYQQSLLLTISWQLPPRVHSVSLSSSNQLRGGYHLNFCFSINCLTVSTYTLLRLLQCTHADCSFYSLLILYWVAFATSCWLSILSTSCPNTIIPSEKRRKVPSGFSTTSRRRKNQWSATEIYVPYAIRSVYIMYRFRLRRLGRCQPIHCIAKREKRPHETSGSICDYALMKPVDSSIVRKRKALLEYSSLYFWHLDFGRRQW